MIILGIVEWQRGAASLASGIVSGHGLSVLVGGDLARALRRLVDWRRLPISVCRWWRLEFSRSVVSAVHVLHGMALLWWVGRVLLVISVVVLWEWCSSVAATSDEPAVVGEGLQTFANSALGVEVGAEEQQGDGDEDQSKNSITDSITSLRVDSQSIILHLSNTSRGHTPPHPYDPQVGSPG